MSQLSPPILVTGTGTDVGKTFASAALLRALHTAGLPPLALKPIETGFAQPTSDAQTLASAAGHAMVAPLFTSVDAVSPHLALRRAQHALTASQIAAWVHAARAPHPGLCLVETAGGLFTPLNQTETMLDLVRALEPCLFLLVAPDRLGTLHDVNAAVHAAKSLHRAPDAVLLNPREVNALDNAVELASLRIAPSILTLAQHQSFARLCALISGLPPSTFDSN